MSSDREKKIAAILKGLEDMDLEKSDYLTEWKDRRAKLESSLRIIREEILTGQEALPLEAA